MTLARRLTTSAMAAIILVSLATGPLTIAGCAGERRPILLIVAIDVSNSASHEEKLLYGQWTMDLIRTIDPSSDKLLVLRFDRDVIEIGSQIPRDLEGYAFTLRDAIVKPSVTVGTRHAVLFDDISRRLAAHDLAGYEVRITVMTDGGNDDRSPEMERMYWDAADAIAKVQKVKSLTFMGVRDGFREDIRKKFKQMDADGRLKIIGERESQ